MKLHELAKKRSMPYLPYRFAGNVAEDMELAARENSHLSPVASVVLCLLQ